jgi:hypothetical protein
VPHRRPAGDLDIEVVVGGPGERGFEQRGVDFLAFAGGMPVPMSMTEMPARTGGRPSSPVTAMMPPKACISAS